MPILPVMFFFFFSWSGCVLFSWQVVVKTKADYDGESKKGKLRSPKIAEFSISIIEGVSERLKVRITELLQSVFHASSISQYTPTHAHPWEQTCVCLLLRTFFIPPPIIIFPPQHSSYLLAPSFSPLSPPCPPLLPVILAAIQRDIMLTDSLNPALRLSLIQLLPWWWPPNGSISPTF